MQDLQSDQELARRAAEGDEQSWRTIYETTSDRLFSLLCYQTGDRNEALDLLQETYLQAFRRLGDYRAEAPLEAWLRKIAFHKAMDWKRGVLRKLKRTVALNEAAHVAAESPGGDGSSPRLDSSGRKRLEAALRRLSERQRAALLLREWEGRSFREVAEMLGTNESTARVHHTRARARLKAWLGAVAVPVGRESWEGQRS